MSIDRKNLKSRFNINLASIGRLGKKMSKRAGIAGGDMHPGRSQRQPRGRRP